MNETKWKRIIVPFVLFINYAKTLEATIRGAVGLSITDVPLLLFVDVDAREAILLHDAVEVAKLFKCSGVL